MATQVCCYGLRFILNYFLTLLLVGDRSNSASQLSHRNTNGRDGLRSNPENGINVNKRSNAFRSQTQQRIREQTQQQNKHQSSGPNSEASLPDPKSPNYGVATDSELPIPNLKLPPAKSSNPKKRKASKARKAPTILSKTDLRDQIPRYFLNSADQTVTLQANGRYVARPSRAPKDIDVLGILDVEEAVQIALAQCRAGMADAMRSNLCDANGSVLDRNYFYGLKKKEEHKRQLKQAEEEQKTPASFYNRLFAVQQKEQDMKLRLVADARNKGLPNPLAVSRPRTREERERARAAGEKRAPHPQSDTRPKPGLGVADTKKRPVVDEVIDVDDEVEIVGVRNVRQRTSERRSLCQSRLITSGTSAQLRISANGKLTRRAPTVPSQRPSRRVGLVTPVNKSLSANPRRQARRLALVAPFQKSLSANPRRQARRLALDLSRSSARSSVGGMTVGISRPSQPVRNLSRSSFNTSSVASSGRNATGTMRPTQSARSIAQNSSNTSSMASSNGNAVGISHPALAERNTGQPSSNSSTVPSNVERDNIEVRSFVFTDSDFDIK